MGSDALSLTWQWFFAPSLIDYTPESVMLYVRARLMSWSIIRLRLRLRDIIGKLTYKYPSIPCHDSKRRRKYLWLY